MIFFNDPISVSECISNNICCGINDVIFENLTPIFVSYDEFNKELKQTLDSNVYCNDGISLSMLLNCDLNFISPTVLYLFSFISHYGVISDESSITHIVPMIKDRNKPTNKINNLRSILISNTLAQIFERILLNKMPELNQTHQNQFG